MEYFAYSAIQWVSNLAVFFNMLKLKKLSFSKTTQTTIEQ